VFGRSHCNTPTPPNFQDSEHAAGSLCLSPLRLFFDIDYTFPWLGDASSRSTSADIKSCRYPFVFGRTSASLEIWPRDSADHGYLQTTTLRPSLSLHAFTGGVNGRRCPRANGEISFRRFPVQVAGCSNALDTIIFGSLGDGFPYTKSSETCIWKGWQSV
jgi:hypothetical protein